MAKRFNNEEPYLKVNVNFLEDTEDAADKEIREKKIYEWIESVIIESRIINS